MDSRVLPGAKNRAGGNRARGREPQPIKNKVDSVDSALRRLTHTVRERERSLKLEARG